MKTVNTFMFKLSLMASIFFAMEIIIFFIVSNHYGIETAVAGAVAGMVALAVALALAVAGMVVLAGAGAGTLALVGMVALALAGAGALAVAGALAGALALVGAVALAGAGAVALAGAGMIALALAVTGALAGAEEKNKFSLWKTLFFVLLMEVFMGVGMFMIIKNIPMGMFAISFACMFPILVSGYDLVLQFNGEKGLFNKKEEVAEMQAS